MQSSIKVQYILEIYSSMHILENRNVLLLCYLKCIENIYNVVSHAL